VEGGGKGLKKKAESGTRLAKKGGTTEEKNESASQERLV